MKWCQVFHFISIPPLSFVALAGKGERQPFFFWHLKVVYKMISILFLFFTFLPPSQILSSSSFGDELFNVVRPLQVLTKRNLGELFVSHATMFILDQFLHKRKLRLNVCKFCVHIINTVHRFSYFQQDHRITQSVCI